MLQVSHRVHLLTSADAVKLMISHLSPFQLETTTQDGLVSRLLYWRDASLNTLDYCIGGMHLSIH